MQIKIKNPSILFFMNWGILLILYQGIPLKTFKSIIDPFQIYFISFLCMSFDFLGNESILVLIVGWSLSIFIVSLFLENRKKIPILAMVYQIIIYIFAIIFMVRYESEISFITLIQLFLGLLLSLAFISLIFISILIQMKWKKERKLSMYPTQYEEREYITQCTFCGTKFNSNPEICYKCSKKVVKKEKINI